MATEQRQTTLPPRPDPIPERFNMAAELMARPLKAGRSAQDIIYRGFGGEPRVTYERLLGGVQGVAGGLRGLGVERERRVLLILPDHTDFVESFLGAMWAGMVPVPIHTLASTDEYIYYLNDSRARVLIAHTDIWPRLAERRGELPYLRHVITTPDSVGMAGALDFNNWSTDYPPMVEPADTHRDEPSYWLYSSGTTGRPKGVIHLHRDMVSCVDTYARHVLDLRPDDWLFSASKLSFSYGLVNSLYLPLWAGAIATLLEERPEPERVLETIAWERPTIFFAVPTLYARLLQAIAAGARADWSSLRLAVSAGEPLPAPLYERWRAMTGVELLDGLGSSEVGYIFLSNFPGRSRAGSSGELLPAYEARLVDEQGEDVPAGEIGDLWVKAESAAARYWNQEEKTRSTMRGEWLRTGDKYRREPDGTYVCCGRSDDLVKVGGLWLSPGEVEAALMTHPAVAEVAVVVVFDAEGGAPSGSQPVAHVVPRSGQAADAALVDSLRAWARKRLARYKAPRQIVFHESLPKTATGKIQRYKLREM